MIVSENVDVVVVRVVLVFVSKAELVDADTLALRLAVVPEVVEGSGGGTGLDSQDRFPPCLEQSQAEQQ